MGSKKEIKAVILIVLLAITAWLVHSGMESVVTTKSRSLQTMLGPIAGYQIISRSPLGEDIIRFLDLDDYTSITYQKDDIPVGLYIGYYFSLAKISAAHSPLVCLPGHGWTIDQPVVRRFDVNSHVVQYAEMVARLENQQELIMFWYQAGDTTNPEVYKNKFSVFINKLRGKSQEHAFVRVSVPLSNMTAEQARKRGELFISAFYPTFLAYINEPNIRKK